VSACGRKQPLSFPSFALSECPVLGKADIRERPLRSPSIFPKQPISLSGE
jgi:hypothetical protein